MKEMIAIVHIVSYVFIILMLISSYHCRVKVLVTNVPFLNLLPTLNKIFILFYSSASNCAYTCVQDNGEQLDNHRACTSNFISQ